MEILFWIFIVLFVLGVLAAVIFFIGPAVLEVLAEKAAEWQEIIDAAKGEK